MDDIHTVGLQKSTSSLSTNYVQAPSQKAMRIADNLSKSGMSSRQVELRCEPGAWPRQEEGRYFYTLLNFVHLEEGEAGGIPESLN